MKDEIYESIAERVYQKSLEQYEKDTKIDTSEIFSSEQFFEYVDHKVKSAMAHNERYTENLVKAVINYYENKNQ
ncbi:hypothetical protein J7E55_12205 [Bacillus sp. ISL-53]|nr:hypothetical protein [Bacillus sp. ISL-53]